MGLFKSVKDMKNMVHEAPGLIDQANQLSANSQAMAAAQQAAAQQAMAAAAAPAAMPAAPMASSDPAFAPIANVSIELYAEISRSFAEVGYDQSRGPEMAARKGVAAADWAVALEGWNARIAGNPAVASRFNSLYTGR